MSLNVPSSNRIKNYLPRMHSEGKIIDLVRVYKVCPESKDTKVLTCTTFLIYKSDTVNELPVHNFIF